MKILIFGCGNMASAMLRGWLSQGVSPSDVTVIDPCPNEFVRGLQDDGLVVNPETPQRSDIALIAVKPQTLRDAPSTLRELPTDGTLFLSIAAGVPLASLQSLFGPNAAIARAMPNFPATIGKGITGVTYNDAVSDEQKERAVGCLKAIGKVVQAPDEDALDVVTAVSGSGPAYVFHFVEALSQAAISLGLPETAANQLALATVEGAGALAAQSEYSPQELREKVTSPKGTTAAALQVLMDKEIGLRHIMETATNAAYARAKQLALGDER